MLRGGGHKKEYSLYGFINVDNCERNGCSRRRMVYSHEPWCNAQMKNAAAGFNIRSFIPDSSMVASHMPR